MKRKNGINTPSKAYIQVDNPDRESGFESMLCGDWLGWQLEKRNIRNTDLHATLFNRGYKLKLNNITHWRKNSSPLPLDKLPLICQCLGMTKRETKFWVRELMLAYMPRELHPWVDNPIRIKASQVVAILKERSI